MKHLLALDSGTTGATALVIATDGRIVGRGYREIPQHYPKPGWVEHDPLEILDATVRAARDAMSAASVVPDAIGITNQRETVVVWDRESGAPLHRAIVWQDRRTADRCAELASHAVTISNRCGLVVDPYFSATKIEWLLREHRLLERFPAERLGIGTVDSWLVWRLTGGKVYATEPTNASRTMLYDIDSLSWGAELCDLFGVPMAALPEVRPSAGDFGWTTKEMLGAEIPITGIAGDQQAALFGQGCWNAGQGKNTYGTGAFLLLNTGRQRPRSGDGLLTTIACDASGKPAYALEAAIFIAGAAVQWLRDGLGIIAEASETEALARALTGNDGVYFVPALVGLGAPAWEPRARGTIVGLTRGTGRAHFARAALEAMSYSTVDVTSTMSRVSGVPCQRLRVDGGATQNDWLMQHQADMLGVPVERPDLIETTALGAAGLAGIAGGVWSDAKAFQSKREYTVFAPKRSRAEAQRDIEGWQRAVRAALGWARDSQ
jgi:glycerol kinase